MPTSNRITQRGWNDLAIASEAGLLPDGASPCSLRGILNFWCGLPGTRLVEVDRVGHSLQPRVVRTKDGLTMFLKRLPGRYTYLTLNESHI